MEIDTTFDFREDANGKDPDSHSPTLRRYHRILWSKPLPSGDHFDLSDHPWCLPPPSLEARRVLPVERLCHADLHSVPALYPITQQLSNAELQAFFAIGYTNGGMMVFPGNQIDRKLTINQARGMLRSVSDRFDLTVECIRRDYAGEANPLSETLGRYRDFFALFGDFRGYVDFFLLQDLVDADLDVRSFMPFDDFRTSSVPKDVDTYREFRHRSMEFIEARNERIGLVRF